MKIAFIGLGLMGGSIAKALKKSDSNNQIIAIDTNEDVIRQALAQKVIDYGNTVIDSNLSSCDVIFLCAPVDNNNGLLGEIKKYINPNAVLTDIGSVKWPIHDCVANAGLDKYFIGGHPMAGSEKSGFENASDHLLENAFYILTSTNNNDDRLEIMNGLIKCIGAIPIAINPKDHDLYTAGISHLPHLIAAQLVNLVKQNDSSEGYMRLIAAGGFKDITRIASSDPTMWQQICNENHENIHILLRKYIELLEYTDQKLLENDPKYVYDLFDEIGEYRDSFADVSSGPIKKIPCLYCDIIDESGAIATIATILATSGINLKNVGIVHNREFEDGALRIEFSDEVDRKRAEEILTHHRYIIYKR